MPDATIAPSNMTDDALDALIEREFWRTRRETIFLNSASTGPLPERSLVALAEFNEMRAEPWRFPQTLQFDTLDRSRELIARLIGASPREIALMVNTSYGINLAARVLPLRPGDVVVSSDREFPANVYPWMALAREHGVRFAPVPTAAGVIDEEAVIAALDHPGVRALTLSWVSFETGARVDLARIGAACRDRDIYFIVDAIQGVGAAALDVSALHIDILSCGGQKWLLSPWGTGFVYVRQALVERLTPDVVGWMSVRNSDDFTRMLEYDLTYRDDARRFEVVTFPYQDFAGMNASLEIFHEVGPARIVERVASLATRIVDWARSRDDMRLLTPAAPERRAGIVAVIPPDPVGASNRLTAIGVVHSLREGAIRLSPHFFTPVEHVDRALVVLGEAQTVDGRR
jgi:cysteine desulfurase / selenocysteine lyase